MTRRLTEREQRARCILRSLDVAREIGQSGAQVYHDRYYSTREDFLCLFASVEGVIASLSPRLRQAVMLVCFLGLEETTAARHLGVSRGALQAYLRTAYRKVAEIL